MLDTAERIRNLSDDAKSKYMMTVQNFIRSGQSPQQAILSALAVLEKEN